jgi:hypothetical protein
MSIASAPSLFNGSFFERQRALLRSLPAGLKSGPRFAAAKLLSFAHADGSEIYCSVKTLKKLTGQSYSSLYRNLHLLKEAGILLNDGWQRHPNGSRTRTTLRDTPESPRPAETAPLDARDALRRQGPGRLCRLIGFKKWEGKSFLGKLLKIANDDVAAVDAALAKAESLRPVDPTAWLIAAVKPSIAARSSAAIVLAPAAAPPPTPKVDRAAELREPGFLEEQLKRLEADLGPIKVRAFRNNLRLHAPELLTASVEERLQAMIDGPVYRQGAPPATQLSTGAP